MQEASIFPNSAHNPAGAPAGAKRETRAVPVFGDPNSLRFYLRLLTLLLVVTVMLLASVTLNFVQYFRGPSLAIGIQKPNGDIQITSFNGRPAHNEDGSIKVQPDAVQDGDKTFYAGEYARLLYAHNPPTRANDVERALRMMIDDNAKKLVACLNRGCPEYELNLDQQRAEVWQTVWTEQEKSIDKNDPFTVNIIALQQTTKNVKGVVQKETKQISLAIKLMQDELGRHPRNQRNGVRVEQFQYKVISNSVQ